MAVRRRIHLRLCAGALLLSLPVAATSTNAVSATTVADAVAPGTVGAGTVGAVSSAAQPFGGFVATPTGQLTPVDPARVARRVQAAGDQRLKGASPTPSKALAGVDLDELGIPRPALVAYQVAATTMRQADPDCAVDWTLLAAIGRVETDHGRHAGARLGDDGVSAPLIRGVALNGKGPVAAIRDTDGGRLDGDQKWDRAVGPMQFLPSTWGYAGVDADGDGVRSPDNINDAALAAAVYLCAAPGRLDRPAGVRTAVHRYNPSDEYVDLVVRLADAYGEGRLAELPTPGTTLALEAVQTGPAGGSSTSTPSTGPRNDDTSGSGPGAPGNGGGDSGTDGDGDSGTDGDGDSGTDGRGDSGSSGGGGGGGGRDNGTGAGENDGASGQGGRDDDSGTNGAHVKGPGQQGPKGDGGKLPESGPAKDPKPPKDPDPTGEPDPVEEPALVTVTGVLAFVEGQTSEDGSTTTGSWWLTEATVDEVPVDDLLLDVGDETWLAAEALADLDGDASLESNLGELTGLVEAAEAVELEVEESAELAIVHSVAGLPYLPTE